MRAKQVTPQNSQRSLGRPTHRRLLLASSAWVLVPVAMIFIWRLGSITKEILVELTVKALALLVLAVIPLALFIARRGYRDLLNFLGIWFGVGFLLSISWRFGEFLVDAMRFSSFPSIRKLFGDSLSYFLPGAIPDALIFSAIGAAVWAECFWPAEANLSQVGLIPRRSSTHLEVIRFAAAAAVFYAFWLVGNYVYHLVVLLTL